MLLKENILKIINNLSGLNFKLSDPIEDVYLTTKGIEVLGYGIYDNQIKNRFCLIIELHPDNENGALTTLLMNPSKTFPKGLNNCKKSRFDQTIRNLIILANELKFNQVIVLNSFPYICGNSNKANEHYMKEKELNLEFIDKIIQSSSNLLIACGDKVKPDLYKEHFNIIKILKATTILTFILILKN